MPVRMAIAAMGTRFELVLGGPMSERPLRTAGEAALAEIEALDRRLSLFRRDSLLSFLNSRAADGAVRLDEDTFTLFRTAVDVWRASGGSFDVTVAPVMQAWGFHGEPAAHERLAREEAARRVGSDAIVLDDAARTVRFARRGVRIDLGGIAKGHALDVAGRVLREAGVQCALLHGGTSSILALGAPPELNGWTVAIPVGSGRLRVQLRDAAMAVSTPHGRTHDGHGHVIDPRLGRPASSAELAAIIVGCGDAGEVPAACLADAWTKPALLKQSRPAGIARDATTVVVTADSIRLDGPRRRWIAVRGTPREFDSVAAIPHPDSS